MALDAGYSYDCLLITAYPPNGVESNIQIFTVVNYLKLHIADIMWSKNNSRQVKELCGSCYGGRSECFVKWVTY